MQALPDTPANRQRAETVALIDMASDHVRQAILHGQMVEIGILSGWPPHAPAFCQL